MISDVRDSAVAIALVSILMAGLVLMAVSGLATERPGLAPAIVADLVVTLPLVYLVLTWRRRGPDWALPLIVCVGAALSVLLFRDMLGIWAAVLLGGALWWCGAVVGRLRAETAVPHNPVRWFEDGIGRATGGGWSGQVIAHVAATLTYAVSPPHPRRGEGQFGTQGQTAAVAFYGALIGIIPLETVPVHIGLHLLSPLLAWVVTGSSVLLAVTITAHLRALRRCPHVVEDGVLTLRSGCFAAVRIDIGTIAEIISTTDPAKDVARLAYIPMLEPPNAVVMLRSVADLRLGARPAVRTRAIAFHADNVAALNSAVFGREAP